MAMLSTQRGVVNRRVFVPLFRFPFSLSLNQLPIHTAKGRV